MNFSQGPAFEGLFRPNISIMTESARTFGGTGYSKLAHAAPLATELTASVKGLAEHCAA